MGATMKKADLPDVTLSEYGDVRCLHLGTEWIQGTMWLDAPFDIELEYVQRMMAWLLFVEPETVGRRRALQLGLGAAALTKFCFKKLRMDTTAIELNPRVVTVCREWFKLPPDSARLRVIVADAGAEIRQPRHAGRYDALQVDLYDHEAAAPVLDSADFYADCRRALTDDGCLTVNLFGRDVSHERSLHSLREPSAPRRCGPSAPPARATPCCSRSAPPSASRAPRCSPARRPSSRAGACRR